MNRSQIILSLVLAEVEVLCSVQDFPSRLTVQKAVYLLQEAGIQMGYPYRWYIRGPYSSRLSSDLFQLCDLETDERKELNAYTLGQKTRLIAKRVKDLLSSDGDRHKRAKHLELLASVLFLVRTKQSKSSDCNGLSEILRSNGKNFSPREVQQAVFHLKEHEYPV